MFLFTIGACKMYSQDCNPKSFPFKNGEQIDYDIFYNMGKLWVPAGRVRFSVHDSIHNNKKCFLFDGKMAN